MRYVAAYLLAQLGGNTDPSSCDIKAILASVGVDADEERLKKVISELSGKSIEAVIAEGRQKLASVPSGGGGGVAVGGGSGSVDAPKEEEKKDSSSESGSGDDDMGFGLFD